MTICMQLYSARNFPPVETQLAAIEANGFDGVETFGPFHDDPEATRRLLDAHGLAAKSAHIDLATFETRPERAIAIARALGAELVVAPYLTPSERPTSRDGWRDLGARLERVRARIAADGLRFAWHNHDFEFISLPDGSFPIEHLLGDAVSWEADLAWIARGGATPCDGWSAIAAAWPPFTSRTSPRRAKRPTRKAGPTSGRACCRGPISGRARSRRGRRS